MWIWLHWMDCLLAECTLTPYMLNETAHSNRTNRMWTSQRESLPQHLKSKHFSNRIAEEIERKTTSSMKQFVWIGFIISVARMFALNRLCSAFLRAKCTLSMYIVYIKMITDYIFRHSPHFFLYFGRSCMFTYVRMCVCVRVVFFCVNR